MLSHHPLITASDRLYFAYGSNLSPEQMARRCPDSIFLGKATLRRHRWQVNERGVANVVPVPALAAGSRRRGARGRGEGAAVEGLLYAVSAADERRLDRHEGVARGLRERFEVRVDFEPVRGNVFARCTSASVARAVREERGPDGEEEKEEEVVNGAGVGRRARSWGEGEVEGVQRRRRDQRARDGGRRGASVSSRLSSSSSAVSGAGGWRSSILGLLGIPTSSRTGTGRAASPSHSPGWGGRERGRERMAVVSKPVVALMYASTVYVRDGDVRARYLPRMERAMADAVALGVSRGFVERHMAPCVFSRGTRPAWGSSPEKDKGRWEVGSSEGLRRSVSQYDGSGRRGRRGSVVMDR